MLKIKNLYYSKILYPKFIKNVKKITNEGNILLRLIFNDSDMKFYIFLKDTVIYFHKNKDGVLMTNKIKIDNLLESNYYDDLYFFIKDLKINAEIISSQNFIDFIFNSFKDALSYYKLSRKEYEELYKDILQDKDFFKNNTPALVIHNEGVINKWID